MFGSVAQLVEQQPFKLMVAGSIPARPTRTQANPKIIRERSLSCHAKARCRIKRMRRSERFILAMSAVFLCKKVRSQKGRIYLYSVNNRSHLKKALSYATSSLLLNKLATKKQTAGSANQKL